jgi:hypothetical protein
MQRWLFAILAARLLKAIQQGAGTQARPVLASQGI